MTLTAPHARHSGSTALRGGGRAERDLSRWASWAATAGVLAALVVVSAVASASVVVSPLAPLAVAVAAVLGVVTWWRPLVGSVVVASLVPALSGIQISVGVPNLKLSQVLLVVCALAVFLRRPQRWRAVGGVDIALGVAALVAIVLALLHEARGDITTTVMLRTGAQPLFVLIAWWTASRGVTARADVTVVLRWVLWASAVVSLLALLQYVSAPGVRSTLAYLSGGFATGTGARPRVTGPFPIWHSLDGFLLIPTTLAITLLLREDWAVLRRRSLVVVLLLDVVAVVLSVTVTALVWLPFAILVAALLARQLPRALWSLVVLAVVAVIAFPGVLAGRLAAQENQTAYTAGSSGPQTLEYRFYIWEHNYLPYVKESLPLGIGTETPATGAGLSSVRFQATENQDLTWVLRGGLPLLVVSWVGVGALWVRCLRRARGEDGPSRSVAMALTGVVTFLPASTSVWPYLSNAGLPEALFGIGGAALAIPALDPARRLSARVYGPAQERVTPLRRREPAYPSLD